MVDGDKWREKLSEEIEDFWAGPVRVLDYVPTPSEFLRDFVLESRPVIMRGGMEGWPARTWNLQTLEGQLGD